MKKFGLGLLGLIVVAGIYYFTMGATQITSEIKKHLQQELTTLQTQGFSIEERSSNEKEEHFILSFDDPQKMSHFFTSQGVQLDVDTAKTLKGLKLGVDVNYLPDAYSAVSFDLYPLSLPNILIQSSLGDNNDNILLQLKEMFKKKTFLMHVDVNKLGSSFKGYLKDIDEVFHGGKEARLTIKGMTYTGELKNARLKTVKQNMEHFKIDISDELTMTFTNLAAEYMMTGNTLYDYTTNYNIEKMLFDSSKTMKLHIDHMQVHSTSSVTDALASASMTSKAKSVLIYAKGETYTLDTFLFELNAKNIAIKILDKLQKIDVNNKKEIDTLFQQLFSNDVSLSIPTFSIANIDEGSKKLQGFDMNAKISIDKSFNITALQSNPMSAISTIDANLNINLSTELFNIISQQPKAMIALMLFQPKDVNGKKSYTIDLKDGKLLVNGSPVF